MLSFSAARPSTVSDSGEIENRNFLIVSLRTQVSPALDSEGRMAAERRRFRQRPPRSFAAMYSCFASRTTASTSETCQVFKSHALTKPGLANTKDAPAAWAFSAALVRAASDSVGLPRTAPRLFCQVNSRVVPEWSGQLYACGDRGQRILPFIGPVSAVASASRTRDFGKNSKQGPVDSAVYSSRGKSHR